MAKLRLNIESTSVAGEYGIISLSLNNKKLDQGLETTGENTAYVYDTDDLFAGLNTLGISLLNINAIDKNNDGDFTDPEDEIMKVTITSVAAAMDDVNFVEYLPRPEMYLYNEAGQKVVTFKPRTNVEVGGMNQSFLFLIS